MAVELVIEADDALSTKDVVRLLSQLGGEVSSRAEKSLVACLPVSGMDVYYDANPETSELLSEGAEDLDLKFSVGSRLRLRFHMSEYEKSMEAVASLIELLAASSKARFVLSFQLDSIMAYRNESQLIYLERLTPQRAV